MADTTKIDWMLFVARFLGLSARVWNPYRGCKPASEGCRLCWSARLTDMRSRRREGDPIRARHDGLSFRTREGRPVFNGEIRAVPEHLALPLSIKQPSVFFPMSEGDLFYLPFEDIDRVMAIEILSERHHLFLHLTKRAAEAAAYFLRPATEIPWALAEGTRNGQNGESHKLLQPRPNIVLGFSAENQARFDERWAHMEGLARAGWRIMVSMEPMLGPIVLPPDFLAFGDQIWVIVGGESGPGSRPMHEAWVLGVGGQCEGAGIPWYFKQWGDLAPIRQTITPAPGNVLVGLDGTQLDRRPSDAELERVGRDGWLEMARVGKSSAGHTIRGQVHRQIANLQAFTAAAAAAAERA